MRGFWAAKCGDFGRCDVGILGSEMRRFLRVKRGNFLKGKENFESALRGNFQGGIGRIPM